MTKIENKIEKNKKIQQKLIKKDANQNKYQLVQKKKVQNKATNEPLKKQGNKLIQKENKATKPQ